MAWTLQSDWCRRFPVDRTNPGLRLGLPPVLFLSAWGTSEKHHQRTQMSDRSFHRPVTLYRVRSKERTLWDRGLCPLFGGCPLLWGCPFFASKPYSVHACSNCILVILWDFMLQDAWVIIQVLLWCFIKQVLKINKCTILYVWRITGKSIHWV